MYFNLSNCRLAGAALVVPIVNYWCPSFPSHLSREAYKRQLQRDQWKLRIAHYVPGLLYWWMSQVVLVGHFPELEEAFLAFRAGRFFEWS
ncbi:HYDROLASE ALPHA/BETA FOLD FAMILY PROTEIN EXPRESSED-RELATED [Salix purpurea]|uniref:HYDROLASE ALPHA/BETA FOLD FAMILY PROTEIN EXPRESSED-RELATED n=1 Tax=Salix purpurea TaxID=77065 RepID=A0A9Q0W3G6_SALPP|nr:HYDROLASE ALPHA/BETA FOLD FAMILY PROTEIN EXPRESSED-RELATED [Salix purpurea]